MPGSTIDPERTYSALSRQLQDALSDAKSSESVNASSALSSHAVSGAEKIKVNTNLLREAMDYEHPGMTVDGAKLSDFVFGNSLANEDVQHLTSDELNKLDQRVVEGLQKAQLQSGIDLSATTALSGDVRLSNRPTARGQDGVHYIVSNWNDLSIGYQTMRNAIAEDLEHVSSGFMGSPHETPGGLDPSQTDDAFFLKKADDIIARAGVATAGLTHASVDQIRECLLTTPEYSSHSYDGKYPEFPATRALYDKVVASDSINVNARRLAGFAADIDAKATHLEAQGNKKASALAMLKDLIKESKNLAAEALKKKQAILKDKKWDIDDSDASDPEEKNLAHQVASKLLSLAKKMYDTAFSIGMSGDAASDGSKAGLPSKEDQRLADALVGAANMNRSFANDLVSPNDRADLSEAVVDASRTHGDKNGLMEAWAFDALSRGGGLDIPLQKADIIYQDASFPAKEAASSHGDPLNAYNADIEKLRSAYSHYVSNPTEQTLDGLRAGIEKALASSLHLRAHMEKSSAVKNSLSESILRNDANEVSGSVLEMQARLLEKLSTAAAIESARNADSPSDAPDAVRSQGAPKEDDENQVSSTPVHNAEVGDELDEDEVRADESVLNDMGDITPGFDNVSSLNEKVEQHNDDNPDAGPHSATLDDPERARKDSNVWDELANTINRAYGNQLYNGKLVGNYVVDQVLEEHAQQAERDERAERERLTGSRERIDQLLDQINQQLPENSQLESAAASDNRIAGSKSGQNPRVALSPQDRALASAKEKIEEIKAGLEKKDV